MIDKDSFQRYFYAVMNFLDNDIFMIGLNCSQLIHKQQPFSVGWQWNLSDLIDLRSFLLSAYLT